MARNRKTQPASVRFGPAVKTFLLCLLIGGAGVGYVGQKNKIYLLGEQMRKLETQRDKVRYERQGLLRKLTALRSAGELEAQVRRMNLELSPTPPDRIVHLTLRPSNAGPGRNERLYAGQSTRSGGPQ